MTYCASPQLRRTDKVVTGTERRLQAEWELLLQLAQLNPGRLTEISSEDHTFRFTLQNTPARLSDLLDGEATSDHKIRVKYPTFFPSTPLELYVDRTFFHPNVHPKTGFVCLWALHRIEHTIEHALHRLVAMMSGRLYNLEAMHMMQPEAIHGIDRDDLEIHPLIGIAHDRFFPEQSSRRMRLS